MAVKHNVKRGLMALVLQGFGPKNNQRTDPVTFCSDERVRWKVTGWPRLIIRPDPWKGLWQISCQFVQNVWRNFMKETKKCQHAGGRRSKGRVGYVFRLHTWWSMEKLRCCGLEESGKLVTWPTSPYVESIRPILALVALQFWDTF